MDADGIAEFLKQAGRQRSPAGNPRAWADRILARHAFGEQLPQIALQFARIALKEHIERVPGEDDA